MQRKRGELVPISEVVGELDGSVAAIRATSPQARYHFNRFDQVDQLVTASEADPDMGFMARMMALCSLPRTNPGNPEIQHPSALTGRLAMVSEVAVTEWNRARTMMSAHAMLNCSEY